MDWPAAAEKLDAALPALAIRRQSSEGNTRSAQRRAAVIAFDIRTNRHCERASSPDVKTRQKASCSGPCRPKKRGSMPSVQGPAALLRSFARLAAGPAPFPLAAGIPIEDLNNLAERFAAWAGRDSPVVTGIKPTKRPSPQAVATMIRPPTNTAGCWIATMIAKTKLLVAAHLVALPVLTSAAFGTSWPNPAGTIHLSLVFADGGLLGLWAALGTARRWIRLVITGFGMICLFLAAIVAENRPIDFDELAMMAVLIAAPTGVVFVVLTALRSGRRALCLTRSRMLPGSSEGLQFTIKHLLIATAVVAVVLSCGKAVQVWHASGTTWIEMAVVIAVVCPCLVLVELATFWGSLGIGRPLPRLLVVVPTAFVIGLVPPFYFMAGLGTTFFVAWSCVTGCQALITAGTLLVVRSSGWRLCRAPDVRQSWVAGAPTVAAPDVKAFLRHEVSELPGGPGPR